MASIFSKIAAGEIPSYKCAESDKFYAFPDISPRTWPNLKSSPRKWLRPSRLPFPARKWHRWFSVSRCLTPISTSSL